MKKKRLQWHTAFQAALQIEFEEDQEYLQFLREYNLTRKPLQIDLLVIKKEPGHIIQKHLGRIFRRYNIVEYKSPDDYLSINDFYKVMAYTCLYQANTEKVLEVPPSELTVTMVSSHYPRTLARAYKGREHHPLYSAAMDLIVQANEELYEEEKHMCDALRNLFADELTEREQKGDLLRLISLVCKKLVKGQPIDVIADALESTPEQIAPIVEAAKAFAPEYDTEKIYQVLVGSQQ